MERDAFTYGYLIAVSTCWHQHGDSVICEDMLRDLGKTEGVLKRLDLDDLDAKPLRKMMRNIARLDKWDRERAAAKSLASTTPASKERM